MKKILVIRNDKLGDFMLAWPAISLLKKQYPDSHVTVLIPSYTRPIAEVCPWIDSIITDDSHIKTLTDAKNLAKKIKPYEFDISISLYIEMRTTLALWLAGVPQRFGPATKIAQLFLNRRLRQRRSLSLKPEYEYNTDLIRYFISSSGDTSVQPDKPPYLSFDKKEISELKDLYIKDNKITAGSKLIFIHAGTGGSAINMTLEQFAHIAQGIHQSHQVHFVLTAGPNELETATNLSKLIEGTSNSIYYSTEGLVTFCKFISICDLFLSGSTGPLHIAGALNVATAAFYPARRSATALRWQTTNEQSKRIFFSPEIYNGDNDMQSIDINACINKINQQLINI